MVCCKAERFGKWCQDEVTIINPDDGREYCIFHTPKELKWVSDNDFKQLVFALIDKASAENKYCEFGGIIIPCGIDFIHCESRENFPAISFNYATFCDYAFFSKTSFSDNALFTGVNFKDKVEFNWTKFCKNAYFSWSRFSGPASFFRSEFQKKVYFTNVILRKQVYFSVAHFFEEAQFNYATFSEQIRFKDCYAKQSAIRMEGLSLNSIANVSFTSLETNIFSFTSCDWPDRLIVETSENFDRYGCEELYRSLKQKAAAEHDQPMVSKWHYREKLMPLKSMLGDAGSIKLVDEFDEPNPWAPSKAHFWLRGFSVAQLRLLNLIQYAKTEAKRFDCWLRLLFAAPFPTQFTLTWWYWTLAGFGERPQRAFAWLVILPLLLLWFVPNDWRYGLPLFKVPEDKSSLWAWVCQIIITLQAALFAFALRNKFRR